MANSNTKAFPTTRKDLKNCELWLKKHGANHVHVCLEASSTYGDAAGHILYDAGHTVSIVNPATDQRFCPKRAYTDKER